MDIGAWLRELGLGQYEAAFRDNAVDGAILPKLTADDLKEIGVIAIGHRRRLVDAIAALSLSGDSSDRLAASSVVPPSMSSRPEAPASTAIASAERRPITVMFCDLVGSTSLAARLDPEDWRDLVGSYLDAASAAVTSLGGHVLKKLGDGLMALFGYPQAHENDGERAVRAALAIQRALVDLNAQQRRRPARRELSARIGLDSGRVVVDATGEVYGDVAQRRRARAERCGARRNLDHARRAAADRRPVRRRGQGRARTLKGVPEKTQLYRIVRGSGGGRAWRQRTLTPLVGRDDELDDARPPLGAGAPRRRSVGADRWRTRARQVAPDRGVSRPSLRDAAYLGRVGSSQLLQNTPLHPIAEWGRARFGGADVPANGGLPSWRVRSPPSSSTRPNMRPCSRRFSTFRCHGAVFRNFRPKNCAAASWRR